MIKAIVFDFDGVILESTTIKNNAFGKLFEKDYPEKIGSIINYHIQNIGISRYVKFRYIYKNILGVPITDTQEKLLGERFSKLVLDEILKCPYVPGVFEFVKENYRKYNLFIASGTPVDELNYIVKKRDMLAFFQEIYGAPMTKEDIINTILSKYTLNANEVIFIGDAKSDYFAAKACKLPFIGIISKKDETLLSIQPRIYCFKDFTNLNQIEDLTTLFTSK
jgi:HAD superfamily hydrolase (TIGR01549 family)